MTHLDDKKKLSPVEHPYADDTIVYNTETNASDLQDLKNLEEWEASWDMEFHPAKCQHITFSRKISQPQHTLAIHGTEIPKSNDEKYLGVTVDSKLCWHKHLSNITA